MWNFEERVPKDGPWTPVDIGSLCSNSLKNYLLYPPPPPPRPNSGSASAGTGNNSNMVAHIGISCTLRSPRYIVIEFSLSRKICLSYEEYESVCLNEYRNRVKCVHTDSDMGQWEYFLLNNKFWREVLTLSKTWPSASLLQNFLKT